MFSTILMCFIAHSFQVQTFVFNLLCSKEHAVGRVHVCVCMCTCGEDASVMATQISGIQIPDTSD